MPPFDPTALHGRVAEFLERTGAGPLVWRRLKTSGRALPAASALRRAAHRARLHARLHERRLAETTRRLSDAGLSGVAAKGWAAAHLYATPDLRPYGDIDLWLPTEDHEAALTALGMNPGDKYPVDLHGDPDMLIPWEALVSRSVPVEVEGNTVRIPHPLDHLVLLSAHALGEGLWRPIWLCDVAAAVESLDPADTRVAEHAFDPLLWDWTLTAVALAKDLLGAETEVEELTGSEIAPAWARRATLKAWESSAYFMQTPSVGLAKGFRATLRAVKLRWPNPVRTVVSRGKRFSDARPVKEQWAEVFSRMRGAARR